MKWQVGHDVSSQKYSKFQVVIRCNTMDILSVSYLLIFLNLCNHDKIIFLSEYWIVILIQYGGVWGVIYFRVSFQ